MIVSFRRSQKTKGQLSTIKQLLDATASAGTGSSAWQAKLDEYNRLARDYKRIRDLPRSMNG